MSESQNLHEPGVARVLVVDDNKDLVEFLELLLTHHRLQVLTAYGGQECLDVLRHEPVDLVILDVMMPKKDGLTVCSELKKDFPALPVILLTARDDMSTRTEAMALGVCEFVTKPINNHELISRIQTQLRNREWERSIDQIDSSLGKSEKQNVKRNRN